MAIAPRLLSGMVGRLFCVSASLAGDANVRAIVEINRCGRKGGKITDLNERELGGVACDGNLICLFSFLVLD